MKKFTILAAFICFLVSCSRDDQDVGQVNSYELQNKLEVNLIPDRLMISKSILKNLDKDDLEFLASKCLEFENGDSEILLLNVFKEKSSQSEKVSEKIEKGFTRGKSIDEILTKDPLLTILLFNPLANSFNDEIFVSNPFINTNDEVHKVDKNGSEQTGLFDVPTQKTFVLKTNERMIALDKSNLEFYRKFDESTYSKFVDFDYIKSNESIKFTHPNFTIRQTAALVQYVSDNSLESVNQNLTDRNSCARANQSGAEVITRLKWSVNFDARRGWWDSRPEHRLHYFTAAYNGTTIDPLKPSVGNSKLFLGQGTINTWYNTIRGGALLSDSPLFQYNNNGDNEKGKEYYCHWFEDDGASFQKAINVLLTDCVKAGGSIPRTKVTYSRDTIFTARVINQSVVGNEDMGGQYIKYCDNVNIDVNGYPYGTGVMFFKLKERNF